MITTKRVLLGLFVALVLIQFIRPEKTNPVADEPVAIASSTVMTPIVEGILERSCVDCHSGRTTWPWYTEIAPISWYIVDHVNEGRDEFNMDTFGTYSPRRANHKLEELCEQVEEGEMPLPTYVWLHGDAALNASDVTSLCDWSQAERARIGYVSPDEDGESSGDSGVSSDTDSLGTLPDNDTDHLDE